MKPYLIAIVVVAAVVAVVYFTKPGPPERPREDASSDEAALEIPSYRAPTELAIGDGGVAQRDQGPTAASVPVSKHGKNAVVRSNEGEDLLKAVKRKRYPADWGNPIDMPFRELKQLRREYRRNKDFSEETIRKLSGAAIKVRGAVMPIDPVGEDGVLERFWVANTVVVMAGCVFCFPPTMGDLVYVDAHAKPYEVDREQLYRSIVKVEALGRLELGPNRSADGVEYLFGLELNEIAD